MKHLNAFCVCCTKFACCVYLVVRRGVGHSKRERISINHRATCIHACEKHGKHVSRVGQEKSRKKHAPLVHIDPRRQPTLTLSLILLSPRSPHLFPHALIHPLNCNKGHMTPFPPMCRLQCNWRPQNLGARVLLLYMCLSLHFHHSFAHTTHK